MAFILEEKITETSPEAGKVKLYNKSNELYLRESDDTETKVASVPLNLDYIIKQKTTNYTIQSSECNGRYIFTNNGSTDDIILTLPSAVSGYKLVVYSNVANKIIEVRAASGDLISTNIDSNLSFIYMLSNIILELTAINNTNWIVCKNINRLNIPINKIQSGNHYTFLENSGMAWSWGNNSYNQLGDASAVTRSTPVRVCGDITFCQISNGILSTIGIDYQGMAWGWGDGSYGILGIGTTTGKATPFRVCGDITFCQISVSEWHSVGIDYQGMAWAWGDGSNGEIGDNALGSRLTPVRVCGDITFCQISAGYVHSMGLDYQGMAWAWGANGSGRLGDNSITSRRTPVRVCGNITFCQINAQDAAFCVGLDYQGMAWSWGGNTYGNLGDNTTVSKRTPIRVCGNITFCQIYTGYNNSIGLDYQGMAWAWGHNSNGTLGDNSTTHRSTPVRVCGDITFCQIMSNIYNSTGTDYQNRGWVWGDNTHFQLQDYTILDRITPIKIYNF